MTEGCSGCRSECWASEVRGEWNRTEDAGPGCLWGRQAINLKGTGIPRTKRTEEGAGKQQSWVRCHIGSKVSDTWSFFTFLLSRMILLSLANVTRKVLFCGKTA